MPSSTDGVLTLPQPDTALPSPAERRIPSATYRLQLNAGFTFRDAAAVVPYLASLGITDCYCSSYLRAVPGSTHGYDVADPTSLNPEIGSEEDFSAFVGVLREHQLGQVLDVVPNHMGIARSSNRWWQDVLENGPSSRFARAFDIDWRPLKPELANKVLLPILGDSYGAVLERQEIQVVYDEGAFRIQYFETTLPVAPRSYVRLLRHRIKELEARLGGEDPHLVELLSIITALEHLPERTTDEPERQTERQREKEVAKRRLAALVRESEAVAAHVRENVRVFNGTAGVPESFDLLDELLNDQGYRLAHWRVASEEINYRRFFDINELAAVRMEDPAVFEEAHELVFRLLRERAITGLRVDHIDGLYDPADYLRRLQAWAAREGLGPQAPRPLYIVVEKILAVGEPLPENWATDGTTGYEFANALTGLFVDGRTASAFDDIFGKFTGVRQPFADLAYEKKKLIMQVGMASEINVLAHQVNHFSERNRHYRDFTLASLIRAIREIIACFPVYRTYVTPDDRPVSERDARYIVEAVEAAKARNPNVTAHVFDFIGDLLLKRADYIPEEDRAEYLRFVTKFQQTTSPVTAKGIEDTALYIYNRLVALNEVGGDPARFGTPPAELHAWLGERQRDWPHALSTTSTHDTKRSEDVRARLAVLSEIPGAWKVALGRWSRFNKRHRRQVDGGVAPDRSDEYLLYQTILGAWPLEALGGDAPPDFVERICAYMVKAMREAKRQSSWLNPRAAYEDGVTDFARAILDPSRSATFLGELRPLIERLAHAGLWNSLSQVLVKCTAPGVPDFYQGTEVWDFSLVDPDNRRPVDYATRRALLQSLPAADAAPDGELLALLMDRRMDGRLKLYVTSRALHARRACLTCFRHGAYVPLPAAGSRGGHVFAFARADEAGAFLTIVPRLVATLVPEPTSPPTGSQIWGDTRLELPPPLEARAWRDILTGQEHGSGGLSIAQVLHRLPVALLAAR